MIETIEMATPIGGLRLTADDAGLLALTILPGPARNIVQPIASPLLREAQRQVGEYFAGRRRGFDLAIDDRQLSRFAREVLAVLRRVPFGATVTYAELAARIGNPRAARAVGRVMANNPWPLVVPCHRVLASGGGLGGYSGGCGLPTKQWLLDFERRQLEEGGVS